MGEKNKKKDSTFFREKFSFLFNNSNNIELKGANKGQNKKPITISIKIKLIIILALFG